MQSSVRARAWISNKIVLQILQILVLLKVLQVIEIRDELLVLEVLLIGQILQV